MNEEKGLRGDRGSGKGQGAKAGVQRATEPTSYRPAWFTASLQGQSSVVERT